MIKDQCNNCKKYMSAACTHNIVFDSLPCQDYVKKLDLSKTNSSNVDVNSQYNPHRNFNNTNVQTPVDSKESFFASLFSLKGRIRRTQYWLTHFCLSLLMVPSRISGDNMSDGVAIYTLIIIIPFIWISITNSVKRLHDLGKSGWLALLFLIPVVNLIFGIYVAFFKGEKFDNKYGPNPY